MSTPSASTTTSSVQTGPLDRRKPAKAYAARPRLDPRHHRRHWRIREGIDDSGVVTLRYNSRLRHIGIGRTRKGARVKILVHGRHIPIVNPDTCELIRALLLDPTRDYQSQMKTPPPNQVRVYSMSRDICPQRLKTSQWLRGQCVPSGHRRHISQDIGDISLKTSATRLSSDRRQLWVVLMLEHVEGSPGSHRPVH